MELGSTCACALQNGDFKKGGNAVKMLQLLSTIVCTYTYAFTSVWRMLLVRVGEHAWILVRELVSWTRQLVPRCMSKNNTANRAGTWRSWLRQCGFNGLVIFWQGGRQKADGAIIKHNKQQLLGPLMSAGPGRACTIQACGEVQAMACSITHAPKRRGPALSWGSEIPLAVGLSTLSLLYIFQCLGSVLLLSFKLLVSLMN